MGEKSVSEFLGGHDFDFKGASKNLKAENEKVKKAKGQLAELKKEILALKKASQDR
jgi:hypothetical protein